ncbi:hypothetical protein B5M47_00060 [candidate division CPR3 bacterium 4484_211]|uniref:Uncharacterized protein n=1 Tax=candidate division CPR3 bacterium 4484_211 TaxID=1968527 RepID=A0A1W9NZR4_UNCC3|nr:MAG: hypothetical protein B5M47_00060 [candidate division CPR3 bacterium 4484_211]
MDDAVLGRIYEIINAGFAVGIDKFRPLGSKPLILGQRLAEIMQYIRWRGGSIHLLTSAYTTEHIDELLDLLVPNGAVFASLDRPRETHSQAIQPDILHSQKR